MGRGYSSAQTCFLFLIFMSGLPLFQTIIYVFNIWIRIEFSEIVINI